MGLSERRDPCFTDDPGAPEGGFPCCAGCACTCGTDFPLACECHPPTDAEKVQRVIADDEFGRYAMRAAYRHYVARHGSRVPFEKFELGAHILADSMREED